MCPDCFSLDVDVVDSDTDFDYFECFKCGKYWEEEI